MAGWRGVLEFLGLVAKPLAIPPRPDSIENDGVDLYYTNTFGVRVIIDTDASADVALQPVTPGLAQLGNTNVTGTSIAGQFVGGGAGLTGVNADLLDGLNSTAFAPVVHTHDASAVVSGILAVPRGGTGLGAPGAAGNVLTSDGVAWVSSTPAVGTEGKLATFSADFSVGGKQNVGYAVPAGKTAVITKVYFRGATAAVAGGTRYRLGWNATADDVLGGNANGLSDLSAANKFKLVHPSSGADLGAVGEDFGINVTNTQAALTVTIDVFGYTF